MQIFFAVALNRLSLTRSDYGGTFIVIVKKKKQTTKKKHHQKPSPHPFLLLTPDTALFTGFAENKFL